jgi:hypothetical protein
LKYTFTEGYYKSRLAHKKVKQIYVIPAEDSIKDDAFVNPSGIAAIIGVDKLSFGLLLCEDHLLDKNHKLWIYEGKPWLGLSVGLNLN